MWGLKRSVGQRVRYAVVGAGQVAPLAPFAGLRHNSELVAIVSSEERTRRALGQRHGVPAYSFEMYENLLASGLVDAIYLVSPASRHREHALAAASHGVHILCEPPLADSSAAAEEIAASCERQSILLMTTDRSPFGIDNPVAEAIRNGQLGEVRLADALYLRPAEELLPTAPVNHPLFRVGIACIHALRMVFGAEPVEVVGLDAPCGDPRFRETPEQVTALFRFPGERVATIACGFASEPTSWLHVIGSHGRLSVDAAFADAEERVYTLEHGGRSQRSITAGRNRTEASLAHFSECILSGNCPNADGHAGVADLRILEALTASLARRKAVVLPPIPRRRSERQASSPEPQARGETVGAGS